MKSSVVSARQYSLKYHTKKCLDVRGRAGGHVLYIMDKQFSIVVQIVSMELKSLYFQNLYLGSPESHECVLASPS